ncbi:MAG: spermine synthase, partial [Mariprofundus sp.]
GMDTDAQNRASGGEGLWSWLGRFWGEIPAFATPMQDEWAPVIEYSLPRVRFGAGVDMDLMWRWLLSWRSSDDLAATLLAVPGGQKQLFKRARVATALNVRLWMAELAGDERRVVDMARLAYRANPKDRWPAFALADRMFDSLATATDDGLSRREALMRILSLRPDHEAALRAMMELEQQQGHTAAASLWRQRLHTISPLAKL